MRERSRRTEHQRGDLERTRWERTKHSKNVENFYFKAHFSASCHHAVHNPEVHLCAQLLVHGSALTRACCRGLSLERIKAPCTWLTPPVNLTHNFSVPPPCVLAPLASPPLLASFLQNALRSSIVLRIRRLPENELENRSGTRTVQVGTPTPHTSHCQWQRPAGK